VALFSATKPMAMHLTALRTCHPLGGVDGAGDNRSVGAITVHTHYKRLAEAGGVDRVAFDLNARGITVEWVPPGLGPFPPGPAGDFASAVAYVVGL
jgi:hypothetical protein